MSSDIVYREIIGFNQNMKKIFKMQKFLFNTRKKSKKTIKPIRKLVTLTDEELSLVNEYKSKETKLATFIYKTYKKGLELSFLSGENITFQNKSFRRNRILVSFSNSDYKGILNNKPTDITLSSYVYGYFLKGLNDE